MKFILPSLAAVALILALLVNAALALDPAAIASETTTNSLCPVTGKPIDPAVIAEYEGVTWSFAGETCRTKWLQAREQSLYHRLGGQAAIDGAVEAFYVKVLADERVNHFFEDINMASQRRKQKAFLAAALGGPLPWTGKNMRKAHEDLDIKEQDFNAIAENLVATLKDLGISQPLIDETIAIVASTKNDVLNRHAP